MIHSEKMTLSRRRMTRPIILASLMFALAACASTPVPPTEALLAAELAISSAEQAGAGQHAPLDMKQAHDKLSEARAAVAQKEMGVALWLADESRGSAELASARASEMKAKLVNEEMQQSILTLQEEISRNTGSRP